MNILSPTPPSLFLATVSVAIVSAFSAPALPEGSPDGTPVSVLALFNRRLELPATAPEALQNVDPHGTRIHPLDGQADVQAQPQVMQRMGQAPGARGREPGGRTLDALNRGRAEAGIDKQRLQRGPAHALPLQDRLSRLSPQAVPALSQAEASAVNAAGQRRNAAADGVSQPPEMRVAADAGQACVKATAARSELHRAMVNDGEAAAACIQQMPLASGPPKPVMAWDNMGCELACRAQWQVYANGMLPLMIARDAGVLHSRRAGLPREPAILADELKTTDRHLRAAHCGAAHCGAALHSKVHQTTIVNHDGAALGGLLRPVTRTQGIVKQAFAAAQGGSRTLLALCSPSVSRKLAITAHP